MQATLEEKTKLMQKLDEDSPPWNLSSDLFGNVGVDINDFETHNYTYFLDNVKSLEDLLEGLNQLSPFADDALKVAESMNQQDFCEFKLTLAYERRMEDSKMPKRYITLALPKWFLYSIPLADKAIVPLGATLIRLIEL